MANLTQAQLLKKYDIPAPRYTSYPTVPYWEDTPTSEQWIKSINRALEIPNMKWSLYIHIPFCETLCTYCGCNTIISKSHSREPTYRDLLLKEWEQYLELAPELKEKTLSLVHLGGGTPTFFTPENLKILLEPILASCKINKDEFEGAIEVDPRRTTREHLNVLRQLGFNRVSLGVQDFNEEVQKMVNRFQPFEQTKNITLTARELGYHGVNFDLIYGLPRQTLPRMIYSVEKTLELRPDRIALYSLAIVPWIKPAQRIFKDEDLPLPPQKRELYEVARDMLLNAGYVEIGMDHFALPEDSMAVSLKNKTLHRNFMGYVDNRTDLLLGLGVSSISETPDCFHQNEKVFPVYKRKVENKEIPTLRGHRLTNEDQRFRELILKFMTRMEVDLEDANLAQQVKSFLQTLDEDGLIVFEGSRLAITEKGRPFLRNACMALDQRLRNNKPSAKVFSQSV